MMSSNSSSSSSPSSSSSSSTSCSSSSSSSSTATSESEHGKLLVDAAGKLIGYDGKLRYCRSSQVWAPQCYRVDFTMTISVWQTFNGEHARTFYTDAATFSGTMPNSRGVYVGEPVTLNVPDDWQGDALQIAGPGYVEGQYINNNIPQPLCWQFSPSGELVGYHDGGIPPGFGVPSSSSQSSNGIEHHPLHYMFSVGGPSVAFERSPIFFWQSSGGKTSYDNMYLRPLPTSAPWTIPVDNIHDTITFTWDQWTDIFAGYHPGANVAASGSSTRGTVTWTPVCKYCDCDPGVYAYGPGVGADCTGHIRVDTSSHSSASSNSSPSDSSSSNSSDSHSSASSQSHHSVDFPSDPLSSDHSEDSLSSHNPGGGSDSSGVIEYSSESHPLTPSASSESSNHKCNERLTGEVIGGGGTATWHGLPNTIDKVFDGNLNTFFDSSASWGSWVGLDLDWPCKLEQLRFAPRKYYENRMVGGRFEGSTDGSTWSLLYAVTAAPARNVLSAVDVSGTYQYVRYYGPPHGHSNIAELQVIGCSLPHPPDTSSSSSHSSPSSLSSHSSPSSASSGGSGGACCDTIIVTLSPSASNGQTVLTFVYNPEYGNWSTSDYNVGGERAKIFSTTDGEDGLPIWEMLIPLEDDDASEFIAGNVGEGEGEGDECPPLFVEDWTQVGAGQSLNTMTAIDCSVACPSVSENESRCCSTYNVTLGGETAIDGPYELLFNSSLNQWADEYAYMYCANSFVDDEGTTHALSGNHWIIGFHNDSLSEDQFDIAFTAPLSNTCPPLSGWTLAYNSQGGTPELSITTTGCPTTDDVSSASSASSHSSNSSNSSSSKSSLSSASSNSSSSSSSSSGSSASSASSNSSSSSSSSHPPAGCGCSCAGVGIGDGDPDTTFIHTSYVLNVGDSWMTTRYRVFNITCVDIGTGTSGTFTDPASRTYAWVVTDPTTYSGGPTGSMCDNTCCGDTTCTFITLTRIS